MNNNNTDILSSLIAMGFERKKVQRTLKFFDENFEMALEFLLQASTAAKDIGFEITLKKSEIGARWLKHCPPITVRSIEARVQRLSFMLAHHKMWIQRVQGMTLDTETEVSCMVEFLGLLKGYSRPSLTDDYHVIKREIEDGNDDNNNNISNNNNENNNNTNQATPVLHAIRTDFQSKLGPCLDFWTCNSFVRNRRSPSSDSDENQRRLAFYIRAEDVRRYQRERRFEVREVLLQTSLDTIHNFIFHAAHEESNAIASHASKFVTDMGHEDYDSKNEEGQEMGKYSFGVHTSYWRPEKWNFVLAKYTDLKTELTNNALYTISITAYEKLEENARNILGTEYGQRLKSKREHDGMKINGQQLIKKGSLITERHLVAVISYTDFEELQFTFKKLGFRKLNESETDADVRGRNSEIANWARALREVVHCWGSVMDREKPLYHGISCKLLFDRFSKMFMMPTSLTTKKRIAEGFAKDSGIVLELEHAGESGLQSLMFDVSVLSQYPNEKECLIFKTKAQFSNITMDGYSFKPCVKVLKFWERIRMGRFLSHVPCSAKRQATIGCMIENYLVEDNGNNRQNDGFYENGHVPKYVQHLFNKCTDAFPRFYVNSSAIKSAITDDKLLQYLDGSQEGKNSTLLRRFETVRESHVYEWLVTGDSYDLYFADDHPWVVYPQKYRLNLESASASATAIYSMFFHWELQNRKNCLLCMLVCNHLPAQVRAVRINLGIFIAETQSEKYCGGDVSYDHMYCSVLHSIVDSNKLLPEKKSDVKRREFHVKLMVTLKEVVY